MIDSFVLFTDQKEIINKLSDEQAGKIFKAMFDYVTDKEISKDVQDDLVMDIVFTTLQKMIDRNNEKWQETKQRRSEAGKKGAEKRWGAITKDSNDSNGNNAITNDSIAIANDSNAITSNSKNSNAINEMAKMAVSVPVPVNVPVSVSGSGSVNNNTTTTEKKDEVWTFYLNNINSAPVEYEIDTIKQYEAELPSDLIIYAMQKAVLGRVRKVNYIAKILDEWKSKGITTLSEAQDEKKKRR